MEYKDILKKVDREIEEPNKKKARSFLLSEKIKGTDPQKAWVNCLEMFKESGQPEKVQAEVLTGIYNGLSLSDIENKILTTLEDFKNQNNLDDTELKKAPQSTWMAYCIYNGIHVFKNTKLLKSTELKDYGSAIPTTNGAYDIDKIIPVLNYFIYLCNIYNKVFNEWAACAFLGVNDRFVADHREELTLRGMDTRQKNEQFLTDMLTGSNRNPTGVICALNHLYGWSTPKQTTQNPQVNVSVYPVLSPVENPGLKIGTVDTSKS